MHGATALLSVPKQSTTEHRSPKEAVCTAKSRVLDADKNEIDLRQTYEEDDEYGQAAGEDTFEYVAEDGSLDDGFTTKDIDEDSEFYADKDDEDDFDIDFNENDADDSFDE